MSVILLVRHGQASWGSRDYDVLSSLGEQQSRVLGESFADRGLRPDLVVHGGLKRQQETARLVATAAGWTVTATEDPGWDEMDHVQVLDRQPRTFAGTEPSAREFQAWFEAATERWTHGGFDDDYEESFPEFGTRVAAALVRVERALDRDGTAVVITSGGPVARITARLLGGDVDVHRRLAPVVVNTSVTKLVVGSRGTTLVSFNEHSHLEATGAELLTYR